MPAYFSSSSFSVFEICESISFIFCFAPSSRYLFFFALLSEFLHLEANPEYSTVLSLPFKNSYHFHSSYVSLLKLNHISCIFIIASNFIPPYSLSTSLNDLRESLIQYLFSPRWSLIGLIIWFFSRKSKILVTSSLVKPIYFNVGVYSIKSN